MIFAFSLIRSLIRLMTTRLIRICALISLAALPSRAHAEVSGFWVWQPEPSGVTYLFPKVVGKDRSALAAEYIKRLKQSGTYGWMEDAQQVDLDTEPWRFSELPAVDPEHPRVAVLPNRPKQMTANSDVLSGIFDAFGRKRGSLLYTIPLGLETVLDETEMGQVEALISRDFKGLIGAGGDDVHPSTYGESDLSLTEGDISAERDHWQMSLIDHYLKNSKGRVYLICRSMQASAVSQGGKLRKDIHLHQPDDQPPLTQMPQRETHPARTVMIKTTILAGSEMAYATGGVLNFEGTSFHHSGVDPFDFQSANPAFTITAYNVEANGSRGNVVKTIEFPNHAGVASQGHHELENNETESQIIDYMNEGFRLGRVNPADIAEACVLRGLRARLNP
jgi:gamma-glutamyl-gamma-aminobutyrate hydrolase PuuD